GQSAAIAGAGAQCHRPTAPELQDDAAWEGFVRRVLEAVRDTCPATVLVTTPEPAEMPLVSEAVAGRLAALAARLARTGEVGGLVVVGGDGARALLAGLGATGIELVGSVAPGVPLGTLVDGEAAGMPIATKAGGFGEEHALVTAAEAVRTMRRSAR
ncbi:MAG: nucleotide-binding domain containing protein, partial [Nocardioidaceae bacterium]